MSYGRQWAVKRWMVAAAVLVAAQVGVAAQDLGGLEGAAAEAQAADDFERLYGPMVRKAQATRDQADDLAAAGQLLEQATRLANAPHLQSMMHRKALELAALCPEGHALAWSAVEGIEANPVGPRAVVVLDTLFRETHVSQRRGVTGWYLNALLVAGDDAMAQQGYDEALGHYRQAYALATQTDVGDRRLLGQRVKHATDQNAAERRIQQLRGRLSANRNDQPAARELAELLIRERWDISGAAELMNIAGDEALAKQVAALSAGAHSATTEEAFAVGEWLWSLSEKASLYHRDRLRGHAGNYYQTFLSGYTLSDARKLVAEQRVESAMQQQERQQAIEGGATQFAGRYFAVIREPLTWHEAKARCEAMGGRLACIDSAELNAVLYHLAAGSGPVWFGATDEGSEGRWRSVDGQPLRYTNWGKGQPNKGRANEHFAMLDPKQDGPRWHDAPAKLPRIEGFIVEWE